MQHFGDVIREWPEEVETGVVKFVEFTCHGGISSNERARDGRSLICRGKRCPHSIRCCLCRETDQLWHPEDGFTVPSIDRSELSRRGLPRRSGAQVGETVTPK